MLRFLFFRLCIARLFCCFLFADVYAQVTVNDLFKNQMVLQQNASVQMWGKAAAFEKVVLSCSFLKKRIVTKADANGNWITKFHTPAYGGPYTIEVKGKANSFIIRDVYIGEVWLVSGQSNMEFPLDSVAPGYNGPVNFRSEVQAADYPLIRQYLVTDATAKQESANQNGEWFICKPENARKISAVAYYFARSLQLDLNVPVGIINASVGGTKIRAWMSANDLQEFETDRELLQRINDDTVKINTNYPSALYNAMIAPVQHYTVKGVLWNQGEAELSDSKNYARRIQLMVNRLRFNFRDTSLPFLYVQVAPFTYPPARIKDGYELGRLVQEQVKASSLLHRSFLIRTGDIGDLKNIHYRNKYTVGMRLAMVALKEVYNRNTEIVNGPDVVSATLQQNKVIIEYSNSGNGLHTKGSTAEGFELSDDGIHFYQANAEIVNGNKIIVSCAQTFNPSVLRYCYKNTGIVNLFNSAWLPALSFETVIKK